MDYRDENRKHYGGNRDRQRGQYSGAEDYSRDADGISRRHRFQPGSGGFEDSRELYGQSDRSERYGYAGADEDRSSDRPRPSNEYSRRPAEDYGRGQYFDERYAGASTDWSPHRNNSGGSGYGWDDRGSSSFYGGRGGGTYGGDDYGRRGVSSQSSSHGSGTSNYAPETDYISRRSRYQGIGTYGPSGAAYSSEYYRDRDNRYEDGERYGRFAQQSNDWSGESQRRPGFFKRLFGIGPKGYKRSDERVREDIAERLMQSPVIDSSDVSVEVSDGIVTLEGTVPERHMKHAIEDVADSCLGVEDVDNKIRVKRTYAGDSDRFGESSAGTNATTGLSSKGSTGSAPSGSSSYGASAAVSGASATSKTRRE